MNFSKMKSNGEKIAALTAYDATFAGLLANAGVDLILVGDSLGMIVQGRPNTLAVCVADVAYHVRCVAAGAPDVFIIADMPFGSFQESPAQAFANAARMLSAGASMVKLEGGEVMAETVRFLSERGIPVCAHVGLMPQMIKKLGGYKVQGKEEKSAVKVKSDAIALQQAGADIIILELIPATLGKEISADLDIPTIGIGSGANCDGQVLVLHDMLGLTSGKAKRFVRNFMSGSESIACALSAYVSAVKSGKFPATEHSF